MRKNLVAICCLLASLPVGADDLSPSEMTREFLDTLKAEYVNRSFAYLVVERMARSDSMPEARRYWDQFLELEKQNFDKYLENATTFSINPEPGIWTKIRSIVVSTALQIAPQTVMGMLLDNTIVYIRQLERLREIGPPDHQEFLDYIVAQEEAIAESVKHYLAGDFEMAESLIGDFIRQQTR